MNFCSDNVTGASPEILAALMAANEGDAMPYGADDYTTKLTQQLRDIFETHVTVFPVATGSAANSLALASLTPPYGSIYCHQESHINVDECGAPEFYTGGAKLVTLAGENGKLNAQDLEQSLQQAGIGFVHHVQPAAISLTQATEAGTIYQPDEIAAIAEVAKCYNLKVQMDGARFANALVNGGCSAAEMTWKAGVDVLCLGATKNGAIAAEAVIFFDSKLAESFPYRQKRGGHLFSKMRFLSVQLSAYLTDDLWLKNAHHANQMARELFKGLSQIPNTKLRHPVEANEIFIELPKPVIEGLQKDGFQFYPWQGEHLIRLVTAFNTHPDDVQAFIKSAQRHS